jgi:hypothetical protein
MSSSYSSKDSQEFNKKDLLLDIQSTLLTKSSDTLSPMVTPSSSPLSETAQAQLANRRVVKSCLWSTVIFSINFVSSILVINLAKW